MPALIIYLTELINNRDKFNVIIIVKEILEKFEKGEIKADTPYVEVVMSYVYSKWK